MSEEIRSNGHDGRQSDEKREGERGKCRMTLGGSAEPNDRRRLVRHRSAATIDRATLSYPAVESSEPFHVDMRPSAGQSSHHRQSIS